MREGRVDTTNSTAERLGRMKKDVERERERERERE
jgi:hypothetical protein